MSQQTICDIHHGVIDQDRYQVSIALIGSEEVLLDVCPDCAAGRLQEAFRIAFPGGDSPGGLAPKSIPKSST